MYIMGIIIDEVKIEIIMLFLLLYRSLKKVCTRTFWSQVRCYNKCRPRCLDYAAPVGFKVKKRIDRNVVIIFGIYCHTGSIA